MKNNIYQKITISFIITFAFLSQSIASFSTLQDLDDSIILEARKAAVESYGYINLSNNVSQIIESEPQIYVFRGSTGHSNGILNIVTGGRYQHSLGTVSIYPNKNRILIAFHGSENLDDWVSDFVAAKEDSPNNLGGKVHKGFYDVVQSGCENLVNVIRNIQNSMNYEFVFTGHSLGGSTSTLAAAQFYSAFSEVFHGILPRTNQVKVITFSAPCVGDEDFASKIGQIFGSNLIRFTSNLDIVPSVPFWGSQAGDEIKILFLEQALDKFSLAKEKFSQPGIEPKFQVIKEELKPFSNFVFEVGKVMVTKIGVTKTIISGAGIVLAVSHRIPNLDTLCSAFFHYKLRNSVGVEGTEMLDNSQNSKPGQVGYFDSGRNPIMRALLSLSGGY